MTIGSNAAEFARAQQSLVGGVNSAVRAFRAVGGIPRFIERAEGAYMWDVEGQRYIDYLGSWGPMIVGQSHPKVVKAVQDAATRGLSYGAPNVMETELAERIKAPQPVCRSRLRLPDRHGKSHPHGTQEGQAWHTRVPRCHS